MTMLYAIVTSYTGLSPEKYSKAVILAATPKTHPIMNQLFSVNLYTIVFLYEVLLYIYWALLEELHLKVLKNWNKTKKKGYSFPHDENLCEDSHE